MKIFDTEGNIIENPDLNLGYLVRSERPIVHRYHVTQEEVGHYEVVREYPNGGKDVEWVIDIPEEGNWVTYDKSGNEIKTEAIIPDDAPHEVDIEDYEDLAEYILYTEEELAEKVKEESLMSEPTIDEVLNVLLGVEV